MERAMSGSTQRGLAAARPSTPSVRVRECAAVKAVTASARDFNRRRAPPPVRQAAGGTPSTKQGWSQPVRMCSTPRRKKARSGSAVSAAAGSSVASGAIALPRYATKVVALPAPVTSAMWRWPGSRRARKSQRSVRCCAAGQSWRRVISIPSGSAGLTDVTVAVQGPAAESMRVPPAMVRPSSPSSGFASSSARAKVRRLVIRRPFTAYSPRERPTRWACAAPANTSMETTTRVAARSGPSDWLRDKLPRFLGFRDVEGGVETEGALHERLARGVARGEADGARVEPEARVLYPEPGDLVREAPRVRETTGAVEGPGEGVLRVGAGPRLHLGACEANGFVGVRGAAREEEGQGAEVVTAAIRDDARVGRV